VGEDEGSSRPGESGGRSVIDRDLDATEIPAELMTLSRLNVRAIPHPFVPALLGHLARLTGEAQLCLHATAAAPAPAPPRILLPEEAAQLASVAPRWLLTATKGLSFRCDLSKKNPRFSEPGFRSWLERRKR